MPLDPMSYYTEKAMQEDAHRGADWLALAAVGLAAFLFFSGAVAAGVTIAFEVNTLLHGYEG